MSEYHTMSMIGKNRYDEAPLRDAHRHTIRNRKEIERSQICHCICCRTYFRPSEIDSYADRGETVICPYCDCDAVIGEACGIKLTDELLEQLHNKYFSTDDIEEEGMEIYIVTDLRFTEGTYRFNAVYAFKSMTSIKNYEKYLKSTDEGHKLAVIQTKVADINQSLHVITEFELNGDLPKYKSTVVFEDYEDALDYVAEIKAAQPSIKAEHSIVKIRSRFTPSILHTGWA